ncbi:methyl-CpG-binding domain-containing protein [Dionaea muscipula]
MASVAVDPPPERLSTESIPAVDLRFLSQSELVALSRCSSHAFDLRRFDDVVIPKIDRSVFNESAGSRKQTYSRLRLAPRKPDITLKPRPATESVFNDAERAENARIISLFKKLFNSDSQPDESNQLVPISVDYLQPTPGHPNVAVPVNVFADGGEQNRKRGRKPKSEKFGSLEFSAADEAPVAGVRSNAVVVYDNAEEREKELVNMNGVAVDLAELGRLEDPYGAEIRRRTEGLVSDEQLLGFMSRLGGQWGSRRRRRRIVDANEFGDALPNGWKLIIAIKKKQGNAWLFCRRYISPRGQHFASCKDVSSYLMSLCGLQDMKCTSADEHIVTPPVVKKSTFEYAEDNSVKANSVMSSFTSPPSNQEKQFLPLENVYSGYPPGAEVFKCHKCSTPYCQKEGLLHHLLSCHKRKRRKAGEPIVDDVLLKNGKYECQFCNKTFTERHCYFGHVGIHVKIYAKSVEWSSGTAAKQNGNGPIAATGVPLVVSEMQGSMLDFGAKTPSIAATDVPVISVQRNPVAGLDSELEVGNFKSQLNSVALDREQKRQVSGDHKSLLDPALDKCDALYRTDNELRKVVDTSAGKSTSSSIEEDVISDKDDDNSSASSRKTIVEDMANHEVSGSKDRQAGNVESNLKGEQVGDGNYDDYVSTGMVDHGDGIASEGSLSDSDSETTLLMDNVREVQFDEVVLHEDAAEPKCETGGDDAGNEMTGAADVQQRYSEEISAVSRGMTGVEDSMNGVVESTVKNYCVERGSEQSLFSPVDEFPTCEIEAYVENACVNSIKEPSPDILDSQKDESTVDGGSCSTKEKITESNLFLLSGGGGDGDSTVKNRASIVSSGMLPETKEDEGCKVDSFLPCIFYAKQSSYENAPGL